MFVTIELQTLLARFFIFRIDILPEKPQIIDLQNNALKLNLSSSGEYLSKFLTAVTGSILQFTYLCNVVFFHEPLYSRRPPTLRHWLIHSGSSLHNIYITLKSIQEQVTFNIYYRLQLRKREGGSTWKFTYNDIQMHMIAHAHVARCFYEHGSTWFSFIKIFILIEQVSIALDAITSIFTIEMHKHLISHSNKYYNACGIMQ